MKVDNEKLVKDSKKKFDDYIAYITDIRNHIEEGSDTEFVETKDFDLD
jgi:hypothetical protein